MTRYALPVFSFVLALLFAPVSLLAQDGATEGAGPTVAREAYVIDFDTGTVLMNKNGDNRMPTSSMSKVMTMIAVFQALHDGRLKLDGELPVSETAWR